MEDITVGAVEPDIELLRLVAPALENPFTSGVEATVPELYKKLCPGWYPSVGWLEAWG